MPGWQLGLNWEVLCGNGICTEEIHIFSELQTLIYPQSKKKDERK
jgi:hypothetical protein